MTRLWSRDADPDNPLFEGHACDKCGTRLDKADRPCPVCPERGRR